MLQSLIFPMILTMDKSKPNAQGVVSIPENLTEQQSLWFVAFVSWYKGNYCSKLDPGNVSKIKPASETEAIFLNFLQFHDKYVSERCTFQECQIFKRMHPKGNCPKPGTDAEFHHLGRIFIQCGPQYFINNSDVKNKTKEELKQLQMKPWMKITSERHTHDGADYTGTFTEPPI